MTEPGDDPYESGLGEQEGDDHDDDDGDESPRAVKRQKRDMPCLSTATPLKPFDT